MCFISTLTFNLFHIAMAASQPAKHIANLAAHWQSSKRMTQNAHSMQIIISFVPKSEYNNNIPFTIFLEIQPKTVNDKANKMEQKSMKRCSRVSIEGEKRRKRA